MTHSKEHHPQVEEVLTCLLTDLYVEESRRIGRGQCTLESGLVCHCIEVLPISECHCAMLGLVVRADMADMLLHCTVCGINTHRLSYCYALFSVPFAYLHIIYTALLAVQQGDIAAEQN